MDGQNRSFKRGNWYSNSNRRSSEHYDEILLDPREFDMDHHRESAGTTNDYGRSRRNIRDPPPPVINAWDNSNGQRPRHSEYPRQYERYQEAASGHAKPASYRTSHIYEQPSSSHQPMMYDEDYEQPTSNRTRTEPKRTFQSRGNKVSSINSRPARSHVGVCTKYFLFVENFLALAAGATLLALSIRILTGSTEKHLSFSLTLLLDPSFMLCLAASTITLMGFLGSYGSLRENTVMLKIFYYLGIIFLLVQMAAGVLFFLSYYSQDVKAKILPTEAAIKGYRDDIDMQNVMDMMQKELQCCGMSDSDQGFLDWNNNPYFNCSASNNSPERCSVPASCCAQQEGKIINYQCGWNAFKIGPDGKLGPTNVANNVFIYREGCIKAMGQWIDKHALVLGGVLLGILLPQIFISVITSNLIRMIRLQKSKW